MPRVRRRALVRDYNARMFRPLTAFLSTVFLASACTAGHAAPLRAGGFIVAPLIVGEANRPLRGALRDFLEREVVPGGVAIRWMPPMSLPETVQALRDGTLDVVLLASGEGVRQLGATAAGWTYLLARPHLAVRDDSPLRGVDSLDQLAGLDIGWIAGPELSPALRKSGARWLRTTTPDWQVENLRRLQTGEIDAAYFENEYSPRYLARAAGIPIRVVRLPMPPRPFYMLYSSKADKADIARFDRAAAAAFAGRRFRDFLDRYTAAPQSRRP
ncbi:hypothetical protein [Pseudoduganella lutea]|uniref:Transporter substrate-binding domain-containing protein n=1 Tax=Pseudoduganella lutea TaxID=321985 RepID=A0A4P6L3D0_9BURK|nr:hypothetical protein [Pseudoduganella lutea]QBE65969.1 hypothetical protein EWM63_25750 [Pseudoduganella lutea]